MKLKVIKDAYCIENELSRGTIMSKEKLKMSYCHVLVVGDVWVPNDRPCEFDCIEGHWIGHDNGEGGWEYKGMEEYFEVID